MHICLLLTQRSLGKSAAAPSGFSPFSSISVALGYIYIYVCCYLSYTHTHTHIYIYIYICIYVLGFETLALKV